MNESETLTTVKPPAGVSIPVVTVPEFFDRLVDAADEYKGRIYTIRAVPSTAPTLQDYFNKIAELGRTHCAICGAKLRLADLRSRVGSGLFPVSGKDHPQDLYFECEYCSETFYNSLDWEQFWTKNDSADKERIPDSRSGLVDVVDSIRISLRSLWEAYEDLKNRMENLERADR